MLLLLVFLAQKRTRVSASLLKHVHPVFLLVPWPVLVQVGGLSWVQHLFLVSLPLFVPACDLPGTFHLFLCSAQAQQECPTISTVSAATMGPLALVMLIGGWTAATCALKPQTGSAMPHMGSATVATPEMVRALASKTRGGALSVRSSAQVCYAFAGQPISALKGVFQTELS